MRLQEFADAEEQIKLWKLISDSVWNSIRLQTIEQDKRLAASQRSKKKPKSTTKTSKKSKTVAAPKPPKPTKKQEKADKSLIPTKQQTVQPKTQKLQVLPKVFTNTDQSNLVAPQTPMTSAASLSPQNAAKTRSDRVTHDPNSVANIQRQLDPISTSDVVKRLTS